MDYVTITPSKWVRPIILEAMVGITIAAIKKKRQDGVWLEGKHFVQAPDGVYVYDWRAIDHWCEGKL